NEQVVIVAAEDQIDRSRLEQRMLLLPVRMDHGGDEIRAFAPQLRGLQGLGLDGGQEFEIPWTRGARRIVEGGAGESDAHAVEGDDRAVLDAGERLPVRSAQVCGIDREFRLAHAREEDRLAEVELVVA